MDVSYLNLTRPNALLRSWIWAENHPGWAVRGQSHPYYVSFEQPCKENSHLSSLFCTLSQYENVCSKFHDQQNDHFHRARSIRTPNKHRGDHVDTRDISQRANKVCHWFHATPGEQSNVNTVASGHHWHSKPQRTSLTSEWALPNCSLTSHFTWGATRPCRTHCRS